MKKLLLQSLLIVGIATTIIACSKDEETKVPTPTIVTKWDRVLDVERTFINNELQFNDTTKYDAGFEQLEFTADGKVYTYLLNVASDTTIYSIDTAGALTIVKVNFPNRNDTTFFNKVDVTLDSLILTNTKIQQSGPNTIKSVTIEKFKKF